MASKSRSSDVTCDVALARTLGTAVKAYAQAAYPPGGSECSQVARAALLETAASCERHPGGVLRLRRRQLPILRAAVDWWFSQTQSGDVESRTKLAGLLAGGKTT